MFGKLEKEEKEFRIKLDGEVYDLLNSMYPSDKEKTNLFTYTILKKAIWLKNMEIEILKKKMDFLVDDKRIKRDEPDK